MFGFGKSAPPSRDELLRRAEEFRSRKKPKKAVAELRKILAADPNDATAHGKLGPLLIQLGKKKEALESFRIAADDLDARGFADKALSLWLQIAQARRSDLDAWEKVTQFHVSRGRKAEGVKVLLEAAGMQDKDREGRPRAMRLLHDALMFEPRHAEAVLMLAPILVKEKQPGEARTLLEGALEWARGKELKRMRWQLFFYFPGFKTFWRWLRA
jgi:tetratricopeptide (TPR) repeat protein